MAQKEYGEDIPLVEIVQNANLLTAWLGSNMRNKMVALAALKLVVHTLEKEGFIIEDFEENLRMLPMQVKTVRPD